MRDIFEPWRANVIVFGTLSPPPMNWKTLILNLQLLLDVTDEKSIIIYASTKRTFDFQVPSVAQNAP